MTTGPKLSRGTFDIINNTYVIRNGFLYDYYPIVCNKVKPNNNFIDIEISPGIMAEGIAIIDRKAYDVSLRDLQRRIIDVRKVRTTVDSRKQKVNTTETNTKPSTSIVQSSENEQGPGSTVGNKVGKIADVAWQKQVDTLLETLHSEEGEEFEVTGTTQSGSINEDSSVSNIFEDIESDPST
jgi:hypothetical protein